MLPDGGYGEDVEPAADDGGLGSCVEADADDGSVTEQASAHAHATMHTKGLEGFGVTCIRARFFDVNEPLTATTRGLS